MPSGASGSDYSESEEGEEDEEMEERQEDPIEAVRNLFEREEGLAGAGTDDTVQPMVIKPALDNRYFTVKGLRKKTGLGCLRKWLLGFRESRNFIRKWVLFREISSNFSQD